MLKMQDFKYLKKKGGNACLTCVRPQGYIPRHFNHFFCLFTIKTPQDNLTQTTSTNYRSCFPSTRGWRYLIRVPSSKRLPPLRGFFHLLKTGKKRQGPGWEQTYLTWTSNTLFKKWTLSRSHELCEVCLTRQDKHCRSPFRPKQHRSLKL